MVVGGGRDGLIAWFSYHYASCRRLCGTQTDSLSQCHLQQVGGEVADRDIDECQEMAKDAGAKPSQEKTGQVAGSTAAGGAIGSAAGAVGGAVVGHPGRGAMVGAASGATAGFLRGLFRRSPPSNAYKQFVQRW